MRKSFDPPFFDRECIHLCTLISLDDSSRKVQQDEVWVKILSGEKMRAEPVWRGVELDDLGNEMSFRDLASKLESPDPIDLILSIS